MAHYHNVSILFFKVEVEVGFQLTYFCNFLASSCIPFWTQARDSAACFSIAALSFRRSFMVWGSGTWRPFSTAGRAAYGDVSLRV